MISTVENKVVRMVSPPDRTKQGDPGNVIRPETVWMAKGTPIVQKVPFLANPLTDWSPRIYNDDMMSSTYIRRGATRFIQRNIFPEASGVSESQREFFLANSAIWNKEGQTQAKPL